MFIIFSREKIKSYIVSFVTVVILLEIACVVRNTENSKTKSVSGNAVNTSVNSIVEK